MSRYSPTHNAAGLNQLGARANVPKRRFARITHGPTGISVRVSISNTRRNGKHRKAPVTLHRTSIESEGGLKQ